MRLTRRVLRGLISDEMLFLHESNAVQVGDDDDPSTLDADDLRATADQLDPAAAEEIGEPGSDWYVTRVTSDTAIRPGEEIQIVKGGSGLDTGWAVIDNPYYRFKKGHPEHDPDWRRKDGETVIGVEEGTPGSKPVADMYQIFYDDEKREKKKYDAWVARAQAEYEAEEATTEDPHEWMEDRFHQDQADWPDPAEVEAEYEAEKQLMRTPESEWELSPTRGHARRLSEHLTRSTIRKMILEAVRDVYREASDPAGVTQVGDDDDPSTLDADDLRATADEMEAGEEDEVPSLDLGLTRRQTEITEYLNSAGFEHGISYEWDPHDEESIIVLQDSMGDFEDDYDMIFHYLDREGYNPFSRGDTINLGQDPQ